MDTNKLVSRVSELCGFEVEATEVTKNNGVVLHGIMPKDGTIRPTVCYDSFPADRSVDEVAERVANVLKEHIGARADLENAVNQITPEFIKDNVVLDLVNKERNADLAKEVPHRDFLDLTLMYRVWLSDEASFILRNKTIERFGLSEGVLYDVALENTRKTGFHIHGASEYLNLPFVFEDEFMFFMINERKAHGAAGMVLTDLFEPFANERECDLYVIPSSIHELIIVPANNPTADVSKLRDMVMDVNGIAVSKEEYLSDSVYLYEKETGIIKIAE